MARKGQKQKKYSDKEREKITTEYTSGKGSYQYLAEKYSISWKAIETWVRKYRRQGPTLQLKPKGRPKISNISELERLRLENEILKKYQAFLNQQHERK